MNELAVSNGSSLSPYGNDADVERMKERLQKYMPGGARLTPDEAESVAGIAVAHGLDPFNGEVWGLNGNNGKWYGVMVGIKGLRKTARRQIVDGSFWTEFIRVKPEKYNLKANDIVYECVLRDTETTGAWSSAIHSMTTGGIPYKDAIAAMGRAPNVIGVGVFEPGERTKMKPHACAKKRAEADAIKQRFDVEFAGATYDPAHVDFEDVDAPPEITAPDRTPRDSSTLLSELGYDVEGEFVDADPGWEPHPVFGTVESSDGQLYQDIDHVVLQKMLDNVLSAIDEMDADDENNHEAIAALQLKRDAARFYLGMDGEVS